MALWGARASCCAGSDGVVPDRRKSLALACTEAWGWGRWGAPTKVEGYRDDGATASKCKDVLMRCYTTVEWIEAASVSS